MDNKRELEKLLFKAEILIALLGSVLLIASMLILAAEPMRPVFQVILALSSVYTFIQCVVVALKIEQLVGYYQCEKCGHRHVPTFKMVLWAMHFGRTRYMRCPQCNQKSWQKKVLSEE